MHCTALTVQQRYAPLLCHFYFRSYVSGRTLPILFSTFVIPILYVTSIIATRVMCEALLSVLLVPTLLSSNYSRYREVNTASTALALPINGAVPRPTAAAAHHQQHQQQQQQQHHHAVVHHPPASRAPLPPNSHIHASHGSSSSNLMGSYDIDSALDDSSVASSPYITGDSRVEIQPAIAVPRAAS
jgi:hypothetical protein